MPVEKLIQALESDHNREMDRLRDLLSQMELDADWIAAHMPTPVPPTGYHRNLLHHGTDFELVIATWPKGGGTLIHDHGSRNSHGVVRVLTGDIYNHVYHRDGQTNVAPTVELTHSAGELIDVTPGLIHAMGNNGEEVGMSLHLYSPMIVNVSYWDPATLEPYQQSA